MNDNADKRARRTEVGRLRTLLMEHRQPVLMLGAGASKKSGVPDAWEAVNRAAKWAWCKNNGRSPQDPSVVSSDWQPWLHDQPWFRTGISLADQYPTAIDNLLGITEDRREFLEDLIHPGVPPSEGYEALARIMANGWVSTVLTTNFDQCLHRAAIIIGQPHHIVEIRTPSDWPRFSISPSHPQLVYMHGSVEHYSDKNLAREVETLDQEVVERLRPLLRDHPLVVVGYRGMEASIMNDLLLRQCDYTNSFARGLFWCELRRSAESTLPPMVQTLADQIGSNFNRVPIDGFDHLFEVDLLDQLLATGAAPRPLGPVLSPVGLPADMQALEGSAYDDLDQALLFSRLKQYADKRGDPSPDRFNTEWNETTAATFSLVQIDSTKITKATIAGWLMFANEPTRKIPHAKVTLHVYGPESWLRRAFGDDAELTTTDSIGDYAVRREIGGTLWNQLNVLIETTSLFNQPFVLKDAKSRQVTPYHPQALKEMIVNALVHRDYCVQRTIDIKMTPEKIEALSPGGLTDEVAAKMGGQEIEALIRGGSRGELKGYRNPVISDLFYGGSEMDRKGSGLSDMWRKSIDNNGDVHFGPTAGNVDFRVVMFARPEAVDEVTRTAVADQSATVRFTTNVMEMVSLPDRIWHAGTSAKTYSGLRKTAGDLPLPPGYVRDGRFFSFYDLARLSEDLVSPFDQGDVENMTVEELFELGNGLNTMRTLLYLSVNEHLRALGLVVDEDRRRAHFPRGEEPNRTMTYHGRVKRATRTIVKARTKRDSDEIVYFEHKAFSYSISSFGVDWGLFINPGYVFTRDGRRRYVSRERTNILSTKRAARDFNSNVLHDVTFWIACLSGEAEGVFPLHTEDENDLADYAPTVILNSNPPSIAFNSSVFDDTQLSDDELDETLSEVDQELQQLVTRQDDDDDLNEVNHHEAPHKEQED